MLGSRKTMKKLKMGVATIDDPKRSFIFIYGREGGTTTTLAGSISKIVPPEKKIYILLTENPHNATAPLKKHFRDEWEAGQFVMPVDENEKVIPITSKEEAIAFPKLVEAAGDVGAVIIDALDTLRIIMFKSHLQKNTMKAWMDGDKCIREDIFLELIPMGVPVICIMKQKEEIEVQRSGNRVVKFEPTGEIVPTWDKESIQQWASIRLWVYRKGKYEVMKTKGLVEEGTQYSYGFETKDGKILYNKLKGMWLPELLEKMEVK